MPEFDGLLDHIYVSIHSRLFGREKPARRRHHGPGGQSFNPLPAFRPGETGAHRHRDRGQRVSIHSRLFGREKPQHGDQIDVRVVVSIHSRLFGREKLKGRRINNGGDACFNPLPAFRPGETIGSRMALIDGSSFNPLPAFRPGETDLAAQLCQIALVSIHSRLFGREKPALVGGAGDVVAFQSTPGFSAGRNGLLDPVLLQVGVSIHSRLFGREKRLRHRRPRRGKRCFNPLPAFRPGETADWSAGCPWRAVSIHSRLFGREKPRG